MDNLNDYDVMNVEKIAPYRHSSLTEEKSFDNQWCSKCSRESADDYCTALWSYILLGQQPYEWIYLAEKPTCTAFCKKD